MYDRAQSKSICQIGVKKGGSNVEEKCGHSFARKYATNMKQHLKKSHTKEYTEAEEKEADSEKCKLV